MQIHNNFGYRLILKFLQYLLNRCGRTGKSLFKAYKDQKRKRRPVGRLFYYWIINFHILFQSVTALFHKNALSAALPLFGEFKNRKQSYSKCESPVHYS